MLGESVNGQVEVGKQLSVLATVGRVRLGGKAGTT